MSERAAWFAETVEARRRAMYRAALSILRHPADAEDAVSAAVEAAWRSLGRLRDEEALPCYLTRCTVNAAYRLLRRRRFERPIDDPEPYCPPAREESPVWMTLMGLPEKYRLPLAMRYGDDMPVADIARALRLPRGTVSSRLARGLKLLRGEMEKEAERNG